MNPHRPDQPPPRKPPRSEDAGTNVVNRTIFTGDNLHILRGLNTNSVDLIYLDPPFNSKKDWNAPIGSAAAGAAFKDTWHLSDIDELWHEQLRAQNPGLHDVILAARASGGDSTMSYLIMMAPRLVEMKRVLKSSGSIYLHCDPTESHGLKLVMDTIFRRDNFRREIVWSTEDVSGFKSKAQNWVRGQDVILFYARPGAAFNKQYHPLADSTIRRYDKEDDRGRYKIYRPKNGPERKVYLSSSRGRPMSSVWTDIPSFQTVNNTGEMVGYPTQKPLKLLERIIQASSNEGDVVLDPFCGCATACIAAERLGRQWIGIDLSAKAAELVEYRMAEQLGLMSTLAVHRTDQPRRTDLGDLPPYQSWKTTLYGEQDGDCNGCGEHFTSARHFDVDHIVPKKHGGTDHKSNLQLLCGNCNSRKGTGSMSALMVKLLKGRRNGR